MDKERRNQIANQLLLLKTRKDGSFKAIQNVERQIGNLVSQKEIQRKNISEEELKEYSKYLYKEAFNNVIEDIED